MNFSRDVVASHILEQNDKISDISEQGVLIEVEIDESQFYKQKVTEGEQGTQYGYLVESKEKLENVFCRWYKTDLEIR